jgi:hypothetical protein
VDEILTGTEWLERAKTLDAAGDIAGACAAYGFAIACGDSSDDGFARDRRLQLEMQLRARGETPPPTPETARADSAAFAIVQTTASRLRSAHAFMIRPTQRRGMRVMPAVIGTVVDGRAIGHCIVGADTHTLGAGGRLVPGDHLFDRLSAGFDPKELTVIDAAMVVFDVFRGTGWEVRDGVLVVHLAVDVAVSPLPGGGVVLTLPDTMIEVPTIAGFRDRLTLLDVELATATR